MDTVAGSGTSGSDEEDPVSAAAEEVEGAVVEAAVALRRSSRCARGAQREPTTALVRGMKKPERIRRRFRMRAMVWRKVKMGWPGADENKC